VKGCSIPVLGRNIVTCFWFTYFFC